ncbi:MAG TPA: class II fructose-bisphosphate aldolase, partial [Feifaniaceae bacterium]|nr:class II fructose-bisphosphate aldolase [Feifaniaceae bacterium]
MPLVTLKSVLDDSRKNGYAVGAFNFNGIEDARGILEAAEEKNSPVILMASTSAIDYFGGAAALAGYIRALSRGLRSPVVLHVDHCADLNMIKECVDSGFTSVMIDASAKSFEENVELTGRVVKYAAKFGVSVEGELGKIGGREDGADMADREASMTDPAGVPEFVERTGVDALAIAIGNAHGFYKGVPKLDFDRLIAIRSMVDCGLVLHGGTGIPEPDFIRAVQCGMNKINVGTELKYCCSQTARAAVAARPDEIDIRKLVGGNRKACKEIVSHKIDLF